MPMPLSPDPVSLGLAVGGEVIGAAATLIAGLVDKYGPDNSHVVNISDDLAALLGQEAMAEVTRRSQLELATLVAKKAAAGIPT